MNNQFFSRRQPVRLHTNRTIYLFHIPIFRFRTTPSVYWSPRTVPHSIPIRQLENIVDTRPDRTAQHTIRLIHILPGRKQCQRPVATHTGIGHQLAAVVNIQVAIFPIHHRAVTLGGNLISIRSGIVNIGNWSRTSLVVETTVCLIMESMRTSRIGFLHIHLNLGKLLVPIRLVGNRPEDNGRMIPIEMDCLHIYL